MEIKKEIGSFMGGQELERANNHLFTKIVEDDVDSKVCFLCSGREAISAAIEEIEQSNEKIAKKCLLPQYTCDTVIIPFINYAWTVRFYPIEIDLGIDPQKLKELIEIERPSVVLIHPFYGMEINAEAIKLLKQLKYSNQIIIIEDLTQSLSFFKNEQWCNYRVASLRKWFAIPDGGLILSDHKLNLKKSKEKKEYIELKKEAMLLKERYLQGDITINKKEFQYKNNVAEEYLYHHMEICEMSRYSKQEISEIDIKRILIRRQENADYLSEKLKNVMHVNLFSQYKESPLYLPILVDDRNEMQKFLIEKNIYTSILWPVPKYTALKLSKSTAYIYEHLLCIPCDQRYGIENMEEIVYFIKQYGKERKIMERLGAEKIIYHAERLLDIKEKKDAYPVHMSVGLTDYCNHKCIFCTSEFATADPSRIHTMDTQVLLKFLEEAKSAGLKSVTLIGSGEPLIHPNILEVLYGIHKIGLDIGIFTNAAHMTDEVQKAILETCIFVRCSVNASNALEHETVHQVKNDFEKVVENIRGLVKKRKELEQTFPTIGTQFVFYDKNYMSIENATRLWQEVGVDYFEIKPVIDGEGSSVGIKVFSAQDTEAVRTQMDLAKKYESDSYQVYTKYDQYKRTLSEEPRRYRMCYGHALSASLWSDGNLMLCQNQEQEKDIIGNIYQNSFFEIWHGEKRKNRMRQINVDECPKGCRCDPLNEIIWDYLYPDPLIHPNFI